MLFRVIDSSGVSVTSIQPEVTVVSGEGQVIGVYSYDYDVPGMFGVDVRLGITAGANVFEVKAGQATLQFTITGR